MKERALNAARIAWFAVVWKLQLWRIRPMRVYSNGLQVWLQRSVPDDTDTLALDVGLDEPLVTVLSGQQRLTVALHAAHLAESAGALGSAMTAEHARLMIDQAVTQVRAARNYIARIDA